jgi:hypothetical protein
MGTQLTYFNEIIEIITKGLFADQTTYTEEKKMLVLLAKSQTATHLDPAFVKPSLEWINATLQRVSSEKGRIQGFLLKDEVEKSCQQDILRFYTLREERFTRTDNMIRSWDSQKPAERQREWSAIAQLGSELMALSEAIISRTSQLKDQANSAGNDARLKSDEIEVQIRTILLKQVLAVIGISVGFVVLGYLSISTVRRAHRG